MKVRRLDKARSVARVDRFKLRVDQRPPRKLDNGFVVIWGVATRVGVLDYDDEENPGEVFRELRPRSEVMDPASLATMRGLSFTIDHPEVDVTIDNARELGHGTILGYRIDGDLVWVELVVQSADALRAVASGTIELSMGYTARLEDRPGITHDGLVYDAIQRQIRYNHIALVDFARAGPVAKLKLDSLRVTRRDQRRRRTTMKIKFIHDGKSYSLPAFVLPGLKEASENRSDALETATVTISGGDLDGELVLPVETVQNMLAIAGAPVAAGSEPAAEAPSEPVVESAPDAADLPGGGERGGEEEEEEDAFKRGRFDKARTVAIERIVDARFKVLNAVALKDSRERAEVERRAVKILDAGYKWADSDKWKICADVVATVDTNRKDSANVLAADARKGNAQAQGRLLTRFEDAVEAHGKGLSTTGELADLVANNDGTSASDEVELSPSEVAQKKFNDRVRGVKPDPKKDEDAA